MSFGDRCLTPPMIAKYLRVDVSKVHAWIRAGELVAINVATNRRGRRPRWIVEPDELRAFNTRRFNSGGGEQARSMPRRRRRLEMTGNKYF
jgi:hypothetical protein